MQSGCNRQGCSRFCNACIALIEKLEFEKMAPIFLDEIDENDGRYVLIRKLIKSAEEIGGEAAIRNM